MAKKGEILNGYFLPVKNDKEDDEDDSDDSEIDEWLDFKDIKTFSENGSQIKSKPIKRISVNFKDYGSGKVYTVFGSFPLIEPWWAAKIKVKKQKGNRRSLVGTPSYYVRNDDDVESDGTVSILLSKSHVHENHLKTFIDYTVQQRARLNLNTLPCVLAKFGETSSANNDIVKIITALVEQGPGKSIYQCLDHAVFYKLMPQLYPKRFNSMVALPSETILALEKALCDQPWVFGYYTEMASRFKLYGCETTLQHYIDSDLFNELTDVQKDALRIYDDVKSQCYRDGHTYVYEEKLPLRQNLKYPPITHWKEALDFLVDVKVAVIEIDIGMQQRRVYLQKLYRAEKRITDGVNRLFNDHQSNPWKFDIDFESQQFKDFTNDADQRRAVELITSQPVVCLSGKGGCGKTHVVSKVFQYVEQILDEEAQRRYQEDLFNQSDVLDDMTLTQSVNDFERTYFSGKQQPTETLEENVFFPEKTHSIVGKKELLANGFDSESSQFENTELVNEESSGLKSIQINNDSTAETSDNFNAVKSEVILSQTNCKSDLDGSRFIADEELECYNTKKNENPANKEEKKFPTILLTAPTGKAANLLGKRAKLPSNTLHQVIYNYRRWKKKDSSEDTQTKWKYSKVCALVVDECSLVSVQTFSTMFDMLLEEGCLRKVVLLGDINQLPSIEPGNFLSDIYHSLLTLGLSTMLRTNHRSEAQLIVDNATKISQKHMPEFDSNRNFHQCLVEEVMDGIDPDTTQDDISCEQDEIVRNLLDRAELKSHKKSQFVAFRRRDCEAINELCCVKYAMHPMKNSKNKRQFQTGDKICSTKNADVTDVNSKKAIRICNGEIFFIKQDIEVQDGQRKTRYLLLDDGSGEAADIKVDYRMLKKNCKIRHAWARTIHTYQGSEAETVVYVVGSPVYQTWQHVYTAVTRGKNRVFIVGRKSHLYNAIKNEPKKRNTSLKERMKKMIKGKSKDLFPICTPNKSGITCTLNTPQRTLQKGALCVSEATAQPRRDNSTVTSSTSSLLPSHHDSGHDQHRVVTSSVIKNIDFSVQRSSSQDSSLNDSPAFSDWGDDVDLSMLDYHDSNSEMMKKESPRHQNRAQPLSCVRKLESSMDNMLTHEVLKEVPNCVRSKDRNEKLHSSSNTNGLSCTRSVANLTDDERSSTDGVRRISNSPDIKYANMVSPKRERGLDTKIHCSPSKRRILSYEPVTNAIISPIRSMLQSTTLESPIKKPDLA